MENNENTVFDQEHNEQENTVFDGNKPNPEPASATPQRAIPKKPAAPSKGKKALFIALLVLIIGAAGAGAGYAAWRFIFKKDVARTYADDEADDEEDATERTNDSIPQLMVDIPVDALEGEEEVEEEVFYNGVTEIKIVDDDEVVQQIVTNDSRNEDYVTPGRTREEVEADIVVKEPTQPKPQDDKVYNTTEQMPSYPGGDAALYKAIAQNIKYPTQAAENNVQGRVVVQFVVQKDGSIGQVKVVRSVDPDLDREAIRVVKKLGKFNPGRLNGQPVAVWYTMPISFKLQAE